MAGMVVHAKLFLNHARQDGRGPDAGLKTVRHRAALDNVVELLALLLGQGAGPSAPVAFLDPFLAVLIPVANPGMDAGAVDVEQIGNPRGRVAVGAEEEGLQAQRDARGFVGLGFLAQAQELAARAGIGPGEDGFHDGICRFTNARIVRQTCPGGKWKLSGCPPFRFDQETPDNTNPRSGQRFPKPYVALFMRRCIAWIST